MMLAIGVGASARAGDAAPERLHKMDPELMLQAAIFETVGKGMNEIPIPAWGSIEIDWFARQPEKYRNEWLRYAWDWIRKNDPNGYLQMQGSKCLNPQDAGGAKWYHANTKSQACPEGFNQEETIKAIWEGK